MKKVREKIFTILDKEYIGDEDKEASDKHNYQTTDQILHIQLSEGKVCPICEHTKYVVVCPECEGTGEVPPVTIADMIKERYQNKR